MRLSNPFKTLLKFIIPAVFLSLAGIASIYSSSSGENDFSDFKKQIVFLIAAITLCAVAAFLDLRFLKSNSAVAASFYFFSLALLIGVLVVGEEIHGVKGWYKAGPLSFDPMPVAVISFIVVLSRYFSLKHIETKSFRTILFSFFYLLPPVSLIFLQPDLGSAAIILAVWLGIIIFSGLDLRQFILIFLVFVILFSLSWAFWLKPYQKQRILTFIKPGIDPRGASWNVNQSKIAIGSGGFLGKGPGKGSQIKYGFLPEAKTDFIFSAIAEEYGFAGSVLVFGLINFILFQLIKTAVAAKSNFLRLFSAGVAFWVFSQSFINITMCLGIMPVIGVPLPFVSYGGSQLVSFYLGLGVIASLSARE